jgi:hypothetical protein
MDDLFPFGFPGATAFYLLLYVATFAVHHAFMHYVVAGSLYIAWATLAPGKEATPRADQPLACLLRDWLPFVLSAAITAGVAPLLFVQIVYPRHFYTANLLLGWRWMIVVPVLIAAFYLLYVIKSKALPKWPLAARGAVVVFTAVLFLFVGFCWTANNLVAAASERWPDVYATGNVSLSVPSVILRTLIWLGIAFSSLAAIAGWQIDAMNRHGDAPDSFEARRLAFVALGGLAISGIAAMVYIAILPEEVRTLLLSRFAFAYVVLAAIGAGVQAGVWTQTLRRGLNRTLLLIALAAWIVTLLCASVVREAIRLATTDIAALFPRHADASEMGGLSVFLIFTVINTAIIAGCVVLVRRGLAQNK